jgi:hypothetical protein
VRRGARSRGADSRAVPVLRKGVQKANAKFEPQAFRDQLIKHLEGVAEGDFDAVAQKLDALGNQVRCVLLAPPAPR